MGDYVRWPAGVSGTPKTTTTRVYAIPTATCSPWPSATVSTLTDDKPGWMKACQVDLGQIVDDMWGSDRSIVLSL